MITTNVEFPRLADDERPDADGLYVLPEEQDEQRADADDFDLILDGCGFGGTAGTLNRPSMHTSLADFAFA
jgi:hypothetical protein